MAGTPDNPTPAAIARPSQAVRRIGCVSYLNAKPLIEGLEDLEDPTVRFDVPSRLLEDLESGEVDIALCPVIDYHRSRVLLEIVPASGIGCRGPTLTVRLFSQVPLAEAARIFVDSDSHTSVALLRVILVERFGLRPELIEYHAREQVAGHRVIEPPGTMLLIGDKVVTDAPDPEKYPFQLDLGEAWHELTGLPFVFAVWMARPDAALGDLPAMLDTQRLRNAGQIDAIVARHAAAHGWPAALAKQYLGHLLRYTIGTEEIAAITRFGAMAADLGVIDKARTLRVRSI